MDQPCPAGQGTPSPLSPTPSPAGSVGSVGSQSSGYSSGELRGGPAPVPVGPAGGTWIPLSVYGAMVKQNQHFTYLLSSQDLWEVADQMIIKGKFTGKCFCILTSYLLYAKWIIQFNVTYNRE